MTTKITTELLRGCGKDLQFYFHRLGEKIYWKCGQSNPYNFDLCPSCKSELRGRLDVLKDEAKYIEELLKDLNNKIEDLAKNNIYFDGCKDWNRLVTVYLEKKRQSIQQEIKLIEEKI